MEKQKIMYDSGNELAAFAAKQINYHVMGYYPMENTAPPASATAPQPLEAVYLMPPAPTGFCTP